MFGGTTPEYAALFGEVAKNTELALEEAVKLAPAKVPLKDSPKGSFPIERRHQDPVSTVSAEHFSKARDEGIAFKYRKGNDPLFDSPMKCHDVSAEGKQSPRAAN